MSYNQIFRRINRLLKTAVHEVMDSFSREEQELHDFDAQLNEEDERTSQGEASSSRSSQSEPHREGKRKPGERDDAYYYAILGLTPSASIDEIKRAYRKLMSQYHPDRVATLSTELQKQASEKAKAINEAYHIIERRRDFK